METLEELQKILDDAPEGATHIEDVGDYIINKGRVFYWWNKGVKGWSLLDEVYKPMRSLADIQRIVDLMKATQGVLQILSGSPDGYHRNEINSARKALGMKV